MKHSHGLRAVTLTTLALPLAMVVATGLELYLKSTNSQNIDITADLAYLRPTLVAGVTTFVVLMGAALVSALLGVKRDQDTTLARRSLIVILALLVVSVGAAALKNRVDAVEDAYSTQRLEMFFENLKQNKR